MAREDQEWVATFLSLLPPDYQAEARTILERYLNGSQTRRPAAALIMAWGLLGQELDHQDEQRRRETK